MCAKFQPKAKEGAHPAIFTVTRWCLQFIILICNQPSIIQQLKL